MPRKYLINSTRLGTQLHYAGTSFDTVLEATIIEQMESCGAVLVDSTPEVLDAAAKAEILREQGAEPYMCDAVMISACDNSDTVTYNDAKVGPPTGAETVQEVVDWLKTHMSPGGMEHAIVDITWSDVPAGVKDIDTVPIGSMVESVFVEVLIPFDGATEIAVGTPTDHQELMSVIENDPTRANKYGTACNKTWPVVTPIKVYFPAGAPSAGSARVTVLFS
jgi:hypothetical protein